MADWRFEVQDTAEGGPEGHAQQRMTEELEACAERAAALQVALQGAVDELAARVTAAYEAGMPAERIASFARITTEGVRRILDTGRLY